MNYAFKLSICIPTYNDSKYISNTLASIFDQSPGGVEVIILDGASTDETQKIIGEWKSLYPEIKYIRLSKKGGIDTDLDLAVRAASGEYCWLMSSNDVLVKESISALLVEIEIGDDFYICNRFVGDSKLNGTTFHPFYSAKVGDSSIEFTNRKQFIRYLKKSHCLAAIFGYMSSIVVRKSCWTEVPHCDVALGTNYMHVYIIMRSLINGRSLRVMNKVLVKARGGADSFLGPGDEGVIERYLIDINGYMQVLSALDMDEELKKLFKNIMLKEHPWYKWFRVVYRINNKKDWYSVKNKLLWYGYSSTTLFIISCFQGSKTLRRISNVRRVINRYL